MFRLMVSTMLQIALVTANDSSGCFNEFICNSFTYVVPLFLFKGFSPFCYNLCQFNQNLTNKKKEWNPVKASVDDVSLLFKRGNCA